MVLGGDNFNVRKVKEWLLLEEFYFLVGKSRMLLLAATNFEDLQEAKESIYDMIEFLTKKVLKNRINPDNLSDQEVPTSFRKVQPEINYNVNYYYEISKIYSLHSNLFNYIVDGRYKEIKNAPGIF